jgi:hypothetical protein
MLSPSGGNSCPVWVDTVGYDDTTNSNDADSFREVLHYLNAQNLTSVRAVVWTVLPQVRNLLGTRQRIIVDDSTTVLQI